MRDGLEKKGLTTFDDLHDEGIIVYLSLSIYMCMYVVWASNIDV